MEKIKVGISIGDINGIGPEIVIKTLSDAAILNYCTPIIYAQAKVISFYKRGVGAHDFNFNVTDSAADAAPRKANVINCWEEEVKIEPGQNNEVGGKYAFLSLERATSDLLAGQIDALVTAPINKENIQNEDFKFPGHTEYLQERDGAANSLMFLVSEKMRVGVVTGHIPVSQISQAITTEKILAKIKLMAASLKNDFWIRKPKVAVLGLNPHAGDNGLIGEEEQHIITPAIEEARALGILAMGPYPADGFFANGAYTKFDAVLAMYHDQGLIPFKQVAFESGVNFTAGLSFVRTSPDHGTAYDIAGKNEASEASFREALFSAIHIVKNRRENAVLNENPLQFSKLSRDRD
ncbi:4-hydroxythreonine-4-phosphate dehydrogenase PdxA [Mucilaginibacter myungsuensis]|uniref:4-hydroxythreonine-4-phosphate dehydrogenase PdxA n=1 Tax=Mucilaginibacter myungsuensis TaxID=649104 RepID=A0A929KTD0_9SPHI|nr:4-hydroxythreonine-4-phosphate dehydrogenase PdxA [Mucilaginibacter myungsuensis]MBE9661194.1 4-hydroxythreonine-4-phosphate dehydrogenase PdxA [Mucilaginibacter myungsuensis]MDN3597339.1 4-hydroxythreonine-4-phosphate dehydrogenase PdxA [Mucilaginibacter myungsuensis]